MRYTILTLIFFILMSFFHISLATAQELTKDEKKALKKEVKNMLKNPAEYKEFKEGIERKKERLRELDQQINDLNQTVTKTESEIAEKDKKIKELIDEIARLEREETETQQVIRDQTNEQGLVYKVQVGVDDSDLYYETDPVTGVRAPIFTGTEDADGTKNYTLGYFKNKNEAETFQRYLNVLRIKGTKIVAYQDGKKVE